jgi:hypothetical protein
MRAWLAILTLLLPAVAGAAAGEDPRVVVQEASKGTYRVSARFLVDVPGAVARDVLTDYVNIPRMIPDVKVSRVLRRGPDTAVVEQEAVSKFMFFSKRVRLILDIREGTDCIRFRDTSGESFHLYEGSWTIIPQEQGVELVYELTAAPAFDAPLFAVRRALSADARDMSQRLRTEMLTRAAAATR